MVIRLKYLLVGYGLNLDKIEQYIRELEAIRDYDRVKEDRDQLLLRVKEFEDKLSIERKKVEELSKANEEHNGLVEEKEEEIKRLMDENKEFRRIIESLNSRIRGLEELKFLAKGKSLKEAVEAFIKAKEEEIKRRAEELFPQMKREWEKKDKPREIQSEAIKLVKQIVEILRKPGPRTWTKELVESSLPRQIETIIMSKVKKKLEYLKFIERQKWYEARVEPRILELESRMKTNAIAMLRGPWRIVVINMV